MRPREVRDVHEGVLQSGIADARPVQLPRQGVMAVEVELQAEGRPRRDPQVAQAELRVEEVEVVVQALGLGGLEEGPARRLVVPRPERGAGFHRREDVDQPGMRPPLREDRLDAFLLAKVLALNEVDLQAVRLRQSLGMGAELVAKRLPPQALLILE